MSLDRFAIASSVTFAIASRSHLTTLLSLCPGGAMGAPVGLGMGFVGVVGPLIISKLVLFIGLLNSAYDGSK